MNVSSSIRHTLAEIASQIPGASLQGTSGTELITGIAFQSGKVQEGSLFCAVRGTTQDGHQFVSQAITNGASACLVSDPASVPDSPAIVVDDVREALSRLAAFWYGSPSRQLNLVGITGTNGKTTTNWIVFQLLGLLGVKALRMGTLGFFAPGVADDPDSLTSPDPISVHRDLARALAGGVQAGALEVASHGLDQSRMRDVELTSAVFTNLTRDHLDYHCTMERYGEAKLKILELLRSGDRSLMVVNADDPFAEKFQARARSLERRTVSFGSGEKADYRIGVSKRTASGSEFTLTAEGNAISIESPYIGLHNSQNVVGAMLSLLPLGFSLEEMAAVLPQVAQVPGRLEAVTGSGIDVYVDYAHTPDALENVLTVLRPLTRGKLWVICGCGGDRDRGKRPQMARIAVARGDYAVFTSDNPRTEDPDAIIADMVAEGATPRFVELDRKRAIEETLSQAQSGDTVLIAGKGHEDYQIIGTVKRPFSDSQVVRDYFASLQGA